MFLQSEVFVGQPFGMHPDNINGRGPAVLFEFIPQPLKQESAEKLGEYGWELQPSMRSDKLCAENYTLFQEYENDLDKIFDILWPQEQIIRDSS